MTETASPTAAPIPVSDRGNAPIVFFDGCCGFGHYGGFYHVGLAALKHVPADVAAPVPNAEVVMVAFLRSNREAMIGLRDAINSALLLAEPTLGEAN